MTRPQHCAAIALIGGLLLLTYGAHLWQAGWVYEDALWTTGAQSWLGPRGLSVATWGLTPTPQAAHALSLALYAGLLGLVWAFARQLGISRLGAYAIAALLAVHPIASEAVAYAASRAELLAAIGVIGACLVVSVPRMPWRWLAVVVSLVFGLGGKESALVAVLLVPLTCVAVGRLHWTRAVAGLVVASLVLSSTVDVQALINWGEAPQLQVSALDWISAQSAAAYRLIGVAISGMGMTIDADIDLLTMTAQRVAAGALALLALVAILLRRTQPLLAFGLAWCLISLLPRLIVQTPRSYLNEHQFLIPLIGLTIGGVGAWEGWAALKAAPR